MAAMDLDRISGGRFTLGLGSSYRLWNESFYGVSYAKPVERLQETIEVLRQIIAKSHTGELKHFNGQHYDLDFSEFQPLAQPIRTDLPIWVAAMGGPMTRLGTAVADGVIGHPIWSINWATTTVPEHFNAGMDRAGKQRSDVHLNYWFFVTPHNDVRQSIEDARGSVAVYASM